MKDDVRLVRMLDIVVIALVTRVGEERAQKRI
jgi:hypothetical protein